LNPLWGAPDGAIQRGGRDKRGKHLALRILGIGPGDEVITSTLTFIGGVTPILFQESTPVFIDSDRTSWNMDPDMLTDELEACKKRGKLPKSVVL